MNDDQIRGALRAEANEVEVPEDLAERTLEAARRADVPSFAERIRAWRDARRAGASVSGYPRWVYAGGAAAMAVTLFVIGSVAVVQVGQDGTDLADQSSTPTRVEPGQALTGRNLSDDDAVTGERTGQSVAGSGVTIDEGDAMVEVPNAAAPEPGGLPPLPQPGTLPPAIVETAALEVEVDDFEGAWRQANEIAGRHGGFATDSRTSLIEDEQLASGSLTVRVPNDKLDAALGDFRALGTLVRMETTGQDVSGQLVDLDARISSAQAEEASLIALLDEADDVGDVLEIRQRLDAVRAEIESLEARKASLEGQVDFSTVHATIFEPEARDDGDGGPIPGAWDVAWRTATTIIAGAIVLAGIVVPLAAIVLAVWLLVRLVRRRRV